MGIEMTGCAVQLSFRMSSAANIVHFSLAEPCESDTSLVIVAVDSHDAHLCHDIFAAVGRQRFQLKVAIGFGMVRPEPHIGNGMIRVNGSVRLMS